MCYQVYLNSCYYSLVIMNTCDNMITSLLNIDIQINHLSICKKNTILYSNVDTSLSKLYIYYVDR